MKGESVMKDPLKEAVKYFEKQLKIPNQFVKEIQKRADELSKIGEQLNIFTDMVIKEQKKINDFLKSIQPPKIEIPKSKVKIPVGIKVKKGSNLEKILNLIPKSKEGITPDDLAKKLNLKKSSVYNAVRQLKKTGKIISPKKGIYVKK